MKALILMNGVIEIKELKEEYTERAIENLEDWFGDILPYQKQKIREMILVDKEGMKISLSHHKKVNKLFASLLRFSKKEKEIESKLTAWFLKPHILRDSSYEGILQKRQKKGLEILFIMDTMATDKQRKHALEKLQGYIDDLRELAAES